ncbi:hypothetical protein [Mycolicibacterium sphagni]|uniref:hypothetical protein n=1 Tax=Mycolicibacterium sphagni TaxID=1786 RepID=UPI0021F330A5|nr:hypothetical protein [Mycolicibacterium sphagni]MCV7174859.1 hypothetical protein [Mycolicibacterium sphagni]
MKTYDEVMEQVHKQHQLGDDFILREVTRWVVHCAHCGIGVLGDTPQTEPAFAALKRTLEGRKCRNLNCVSNGGTERRRQ